MYLREQSNNPREIMARTPVRASDADIYPSKRAPWERGPLSSAQHAIGGSMIVGLTVATVLLWLLWRPPGQPTSRYLGELVGTTAILLFSCSLVLATKAPRWSAFLGASTACSCGIAGWRWQASRCLSPITSWSRPCRQRSTTASATLLGTSRWLDWRCYSYGRSSHDCLSLAAASARPTSVGCRSTA